MRRATSWPITRRTAILILGILAAAYAVSRWMDNESPLVRTRPPGAADPLNEAIPIEGGVFVRGGENLAPGVDPASPYSPDGEGRRRTNVTGFWMQRHPVTNEEYLRFDPDHEFPVGQERHPVVNVTWLEAMAYASFVGGTLPTEWQWEFAARGTEGRIYPWGDSEPSCDHAHFRGCDPSGTIEVMTRPDGATPESIHDLAGNVWEWVTPSWFDPRRYAVNRDAPRLRGGSFAEDEFFLRASNRNNGFFLSFKGANIGFRVVWPLD